MGLNDTWLKENLINSIVLMKLRLWKYQNVLLPNEIIGVGVKLKVFFFIINKK